MKLEISVVFSELGASSSEIAKQVSETCSYA